MKSIFTIGYSRWTPASRMSKLIQTLKSNNVTKLVDVRLSPASSSMTGSYGPKDWTLQPLGQGISTFTVAAQMKYIWIPELGNPQKNDPSQALLRAHIATRDENWPVHRGLRLLYEEMENGETLALLCTCKDYENCHRRLIAEAIRDSYFDGNLEIINLR